MRRLPTLLTGAAAGAIAAALFLRRRSAERLAPGGTDPRADELRHKLAEARRAAAEEEEVQAAEHGAETTAADDPAATAPSVQADPPADEFEAMRRRVHDEARAAADEMRRSGEEPPET